MASNSSSDSDQFAPLHTRLLKSKEEALAYASNHARSNRFGLSTKRSAEAGRSIDLCCDRGSYHGRREKPKPYVAGELRKRKREVKQTDCPYEVHVRYQKRQDMWKASEGTKGHPEASFHNHKPSERASAHFSNRRPTQAEKEEILRLDKAGFKTARIITILQQNQEEHGGSTADILTGPRDIANIIATNRKEANNGLANAESAIKMLQKRSRRYTFSEDKDGHDDDDGHDDKDGHDRRNCPQKQLQANDFLEVLPSADHCSLSVTPSVASSRSAVSLISATLAPAVPSTASMPSPLPFSLDDIGLASDDTSSDDIAITQSRSLPKALFSDSVFGPYVTIIPMDGDGNCGFRAIAQGLFKQQKDWHLIRKHLLTYLKRFGQNDTNSYALSAGTTFGKLENSLKWHQLECHSAQAPVSKWFNDEWHGQLVADLYNTIVINAKAIGGTKVLLRAPTEFTTVGTALQAVLSGHRLVGLLFHQNGSHFDALEFDEEARALLSDRTYCTVMLSSAKVSMS